MIPQQPVPSMGIVCQKSFPRGDHAPLSGSNDAPIERPPHSAATISELALEVLDLAYSAVAMIDLVIYSGSSGARDQPSQDLAFKEIDTMRYNN